MIKPRSSLCPVSTEWRRGFAEGLPLVRAVGWSPVISIPRADTAGLCQDKEACEFRDSHKKTEKVGAVVLGISPDKPSAQKKFEEKFELPFTLLGDADKKVCNLYGVIQEKNMYGNKVMGVVRTTFIIGPDGRDQAHLLQSKAGRPCRGSAGFLEKRCQGCGVIP